MLCHFILLLFFSLSTGSDTERWERGEVIEPDWEGFKETFKKAYTTREEERRRRSIYMERVEECNVNNMEYNAGKVGNTAGITTYSDMTTDEFFELL